MAESWVVRDIEDIHQGQPDIPGEEDDIYKVPYDGRGFLLNQRIMGFEKKFLLSIDKDTLVDKEEIKYEFEKITGLGKELLGDDFKGYLFELEYFEETSQNEIRRINPETKKENYGTKEGYELAKKNLLPNLKKHCEEDRLKLFKYFKDIKEFYRILASLSKKIEVLDISKIEKTLIDLKQEAGSNINSENLKHLLDKFFSTMYSDWGLRGNGTHYFELKVVQGRANTLRPNDIFLNKRLIHKFNLKEGMEVTVVVKGDYEKKCIINRADNVKKGEIGLRKALRNELNIEEKEIIKLLF